MSETTDELLSKVEDALWIGDGRAAGLLLHRVLLQDFTNRQAWQLLHSMRGGEQPLKEFQRSFSQRYYPHLMHLLDETPAPLGRSSAPAEPLPPPFKPLPLASPVKPFVESIEEEDEISAEALEALLPSGKPLFDVPAPVVRSPRPAPASLDQPAEPSHPAPASLDQPAVAIQPAPLPLEQPAEPIQPAPAASIETQARTAAGVQDLTAGVTGVGLAQAALGEAQAIEPAPPGELTCPGCGVELSGMETLCAYCGLNLAAVLHLAPPPVDAPPALDLPFCPACGKTCPAGAYFCDTCGATLLQPGTPGAAPAPTLPEPDTQPIPAAASPSLPAAESPASSAQPATPLAASGLAALPLLRPEAVAQAAPGVAAAGGTLAITRENSPSGALFKYTIWVDGLAGEKISNNQRLVLNLPAGQHTIQVTRGKRASQPLAIELAPGRNVQLYCQPPKVKGSGPRLALLSAGRPVPQKTRWWAGYLLLVLVLACLAAGVGTVVYYFTLVAK